jgi:carbamoylphosphate synthase large subunit
MRFKVYPYKQGSRSAKMLASALGGKVLKRVNSSFIPKAGDVVINWGSSEVPDFGPATVLNASVNTAQCKLASFLAFKEKGIKIPSFWTDKTDIPDSAFPVMCRTKLRGHSGDGIVIAHSREGLVDAPLYTKYMKKKHEYRLHVFKDEVFFCQRKARKKNVDSPNWMVRNLDGGFAFVETAYDNVPGVVIDQARWALTALGLDFGGVDVIYNENTGLAYVLEINSACGLEERTADNYAGVFYADVAASAADTAHPTDVED